MLRIFTTIIICLISVNSYADVIQLLDEGTNQGYPSRLNCVGAGVVCTRSGTTGILTIDGGGGSDTPGGSDTQVQYNDAGAFGGDAGLTYIEATNLLTVDGTVVVDGLEVTGGSEKILTSSGSVTLGGTGNTNNEKILFDFESVANTATISSVTGVTAISLTSIGLTAGGKIIGNASLDVKNGATTSGVLAIFEDSDTGTNKATFQVPSLTADTVYILPSDDGDSGEQLQTNGSGTLSWEAAGSGGGGGGGCWELDGNSDLMPVDGACTDTLWELDGNGDLQPQA